MRCIQVSAGGSRVAVAAPALGAVIAIPPLPAAIAPIASTSGRVSPTDAIHVLLFRRGYPSPAYGQQSCRLPPCVAAMTVGQLDSQGDEEVLQVEEEEITVEGLALPSQRYQRRSAMKDIKQLRAQANTLARDKELINVQIGANGLTKNVVISIMGVLGKHEYVRVKMGEGCGLERSALANALERYLDCVSVHEIGFTVTLYRDSRHPRPSNIPDIQGAYASEVVAAEAPIAVTPERPAPKKKTSNKQPAAVKRTARSQLPPEFY